MLTKFMQGIAFVAWASVIAIPWLWMLRSIDFNLGSLSAEILFVLIAVFNSAISEAQKVPKGQ